MPAIEAGSSAFSARATHCPKGEKRSTEADEQELPSIRELLSHHRRRLAEAGELPSLVQLPRYGPEELARFHPPPYDAL